MNIEMTMIFFLPNDSDKDPKNSMLTANAIVDTERDKLAVVGETPKSLENTGIKG